MSLDESSREGDAASRGGPDMPKGSVRRTTRSGRWLKLRDVADRMRIEHPSAHYRVKFVRRLLQRLEKRDGCSYLKRLGKKDWYVAASALEALDPHPPEVIRKLRDDLTSTVDDVRDLRRKVNGHGGRISDLEKARKGFEAYMAIMAGK